MLHHCLKFHPVNRMYSYLVIWLKDVGEFSSPSRFSIKLYFKLKFRPRTMTDEHIDFFFFWKCWLAAIAQGELTLGRVASVDVSPLPCLRCFHGGWRRPQGPHRHRGAILWVARHDCLVEGSFCSGDCAVNTQARRQYADISVYSCIYYSHVITH